MLALCQVAVDEPSGCLCLRFPKGGAVWAQSQIRYHARVATAVGCRRFDVYGKFAAAVGIRSCKSRQLAKNIHPQHYRRLASGPWDSIYLLRGPSLVVIGEGANG